MDTSLEEVWAALDGVVDPEIPVVTLRELGILRDIRVGPHGLEIVITPTYSGCPAMDQMADDVRTALHERGLEGTVVTQLAPAWTTDWISEAAREKLRAYGIAPPQAACVPSARSGHETAHQRVLHFMPRAAAGHPGAVSCPRCGSPNTVESSRFGSTACKALYKCLSCQEPFDYFKPY